eukprot:3045941-Alexandrium_andersonii.AAC.1
MAAARRPAALRREHGCSTWQRWCPEPKMSRFWGRGRRWGALGDGRPAAVSREHACSALQRWCPDTEMGK